MSNADQPLTISHMLASDRFKSGIVKCRLLHMDGRSVVQPDLLLSTNHGGKRFYIPKFFDPNQIAFFSNTNDDFCRLTMATNGTMLRVGFFARDKIRICADGSVIYKCHFSRLDGDSSPKPCGTWREHDGKYLLQLYHHTNDAGHAGISSSREMWASRRNIQGNLWLHNIGYGYFTSVERIRTEEDLNDIAMSSSGLTGFVPTNAPYHPMYASRVRIPQQTAMDRARTLKLWIDCELLAPNHLWMHKPMDQAAYYEVVLPKVFRIGVEPNCNLQIVANRVEVAERSRRIFKYVIVGDADTHAGLQAPFHEEETTQVATVQQFDECHDIIECWKKLQNTNQWSSRLLEYAELKPLPPR